MADKDTVVVDFIASYTAQKGGAPTTREIGKTVGWPWGEGMDTSDSDLEDGRMTMNMKIC